MAFMKKWPNPLPSVEEAKKLYGNKRSTAAESACTLLEEIKGYERKYQMASEAFFDQYPDHELAPDESDWFLWCGVYMALVRMLKENRITREDLEG